MKKIIFIFCMLTIPAVAGTPSTSCPDGYIAKNNSHITIATSCPSGTVSVGDAESCLVSNPSGACIMYAPAGMSFTDETGTYEFTDTCPMS